MVSPWKGRKLRGPGHPTFRHTGEGWGRLVCPKSVYHLPLSQQLTNNAEDGKDAVGIIINPGIVYFCSSPGLYPRQSSCPIFMRMSRVGS